MVTRPDTRPTGAAPRVAIDTTPLIGRRTGIGRLVAGLVDALEDGPVRRGELDLRRIAFTWRGRDDAGAQRLPLPARAAQQVWARTDLIPIEWWSGRVDVVHGTNYVVPPTRRAGRLVSVHDLTPVRFPEMCTADTLRFPHLVRRAVEHGAHVHCDSATVAAEVLDWLGDGAGAGDLAGRIHVVHPGIPPLDLPPGTTVQPTGPPYLLSIGTAEPRKDLPGLVRAFAELAGTHPDLRLVIAGAPGWGTDALDAAVAVLPGAVRARIDRPGWIDDTERVRLLAGATVFAYPSLYEGFGFPPLEAMAMGVPVVATRAGSLPEVLGDACPLVPAGDPHAFASAVDLLLADDAQRATQVEAGRRQAAKYRWSAMADGITSVYREVACAR